jgi:hypothetical protein
VASYAQRRSHDLTHFNRPERMMSGRVRPPAFRLDNERIVRRHVYATALAAFFRKHPEAFGRGQVRDLFGGDEVERDGQALLCEFLEARPQEVGEAVRAITPPKLQDELGLADWKWAQQMTRGSPISTARVREAYEADCDYYRRAENEASAAARHSKAKLYQFVRSTIQRRSLLGVLANRGLYPKYGFPVDVVPLEVSLEAQREAKDQEGLFRVGVAGLELNRDLKMAISEYAPGSEVVAGGYVWRSVGLKVLPDRRLEEIHYYSCPCGGFTFLDPGQTLDACPQCGEARKGRRQNRYIRPEFGFVTGSRRPARVSTRKPTRQYASRVAFAGYLAPDAQQYDAVHPGLDVGLPNPARLVSINSGMQQRGFRVCQSCGFAEPVAQVARRSALHESPRGTNCRGTVTYGVDLGHDFMTDVLELRSGAALRGAYSAWWSLAYAIVEGASTVLGIRRDDLDVVVRPSVSGFQSIFLFDSVPGGAGHVHRIREHLSAVLRQALERVSTCSCEETTSCYECLRTFSNQRLHSSLQRGLAADALKVFLGGQMEAITQPPRSERRRDTFDLIPNVALRACVERAVARGAPSPDIGFELAASTGRVIGEADVAWPSLRIAVVEHAPADRTPWTANGWRLFTTMEVTSAPDAHALLFGDIEAE